MKTMIAALAAAFVTGAVLAGNVYYVDPDGNDGNDGLSPATARKSLVEAMKLVTANNDDIVYAAEGTYNYKSEGGYRVKIPAGTKLIASGRRSETIIEGEPAPGVATDASPWGCGTGAISCVYLNSDAELHGFTVRYGYGQEFAQNKYGGGVVGKEKATCIAYECTIVSNVAGTAAGAYGVTAIRCDIGRNTARTFANMQSADAYSCYLHEENTPYDTYCYGYGSSCTLNGCTIMPKLSGGKDAGVNGATCINCYTRDERNYSKLWYTAYSAKGNGTVVNDGCFTATSAEMAMGDADHRPVFGSNRGIDKGSWHAYTNGASAKVLAYLDKDYAGGPRLSGLEMDMGCGECQIPEQDFAASLHPAPQFAIVSVPQAGVAPTGGVALVICGGSEATWRWTVPESTKVAVAYSLTVAVEGEATFAAYIGGAATPACTVTAVDGAVPFGYLYTGTHDVRLVVTGTGRASISAVRCSDFGANNWYVKPDGNDLADGKTPSTARRTLVEVMKLAGRGDVVHAAPGTYAEGFSQTLLDHTTNRVIVAVGVGLVADEGPSVTFIEGAKPSGGGNTGPDAIRCVALQFESWLKGFTLKNGATALRGSYQDYGGGVYYSSHTSSAACTYDCVFDNCSARRGGGGYGGVFAGCRFESNCSGSEDARSLYSCKLAVNCLFKSTAYGIFTILNCSAVGCQIKGNGTQQAYNTYFGVAGNSNMERHDCKSVGVELPSAETLDDAYGPLCGSALVNAGDVSHYRANFPAAWAMFSGTAINGSKRVLGGAIDVGAGEFAFNPSSVPETAGVDVVVGGGVITVTRNYKSPKLVTGFTLNGAVYAFPIDGSADSVAVAVSCPVEEIDLGLTYADAGDYYVNQAAGDDGNFGYAPSNAFKTLKKALETATSGGTVHVAPGVYGDGTMTRGGNAYVAVVPAGVKLVATGTKDECVIEGSADMSVEQNANPYGCGSGAVRCVFLNNNAQIHGFTVRNGHGTTWSTVGDVYSCGGIAGTGDTTLVYDCTVTNNYGGNGPGINSTVAVRCEIGWNWSGSEGGGANMRTAKAYNCYLHHERTPGQRYAYGYNAATIVACTVLEEASGQEAGVVNSTVCNSYVRHERNGSALYRTYYESKGTGATPDDGSLLVTRSQMQLGDDLVPIYGANVGIDMGSWFRYTNNVPAVALKYLDLDFNGNPRISNGAMDLGCCELDYCEIYSGKLRAGRRVYTVTSASPMVTLTNGGVELSDGDTLAGTFTAVRPGESLVIAEVAGGGVLTVTLDGEPLAGCDGRYGFVCEPGTVHELAFGFAGEGSATVKQVRGPVAGISLNFR